jgi:hypothetical protein
MSAPIVNRKNLERYVGQRVRMFGKFAPGANTNRGDGTFVILTTDGAEIKCRLNSSYPVPADNGSGVARVFCVVGRVEADASLTIDTPIADLGTDMDMGLMDEATNLQFRKEFSHLFYAPGTQASYA